MKRLTSLDLYTTIPPGSVVETDSIEDVASGMYPVYWMPSGGRLKVSTSAAALVVDSGRLELNENFAPTKFFLNSRHRQVALASRRMLTSVSRLAEQTRAGRGAVEKLKSTISSDVKTRYLWNPHQAGYCSWETIDTRIRKLHSFERLDQTGSSVHFEPTFSIQDREEYIGRASEVIEEGVRRVEEAFPDRKHVILTGGKDSQLICLIPKLRPEQWYVFSADPNFALVSEWIRDNGISVADVIRHDGRNEESMLEFKEKVVCGDLFSSPMHIRYGPTLRRIAQSFDGQCIFWLGSMPRQAHLFYGDGHPRDDAEPQTRRDRFFRILLDYFPAWQGNMHQTYTNFVGCPFLCPYDSEKFWTEFRRHVDPVMIGGSGDLRYEIGDRLFGRQVRWTEKNPGPKAYDYSQFWFATNRYYQRHLAAALTTGSHEWRPMRGLGLAGLEGAAARPNVR